MKFTLTINVFSHAFMQHAQDMSLAVIAKKQRVILCGLVAKCATI